MHYLHQVFNKFKAILNILTIYKQASSKSSACSNIKSYIFFKKRLIFSFTFTYEWYSSWAKSPPGGDFVIYQIWGRFQLSGGDFCRFEYTKVRN